MNGKTVHRTLALGLALFLACCAGDQGYHEAMSSKTALAGNSRTFNATPEETFAAAKVTLVRRGFTVEQADQASGLIKANRNLQDKDDPNVSYNVVASIDFTATSAARDATIVTAAATQQTVLHRSWHTWWHLLWLIPLFPTGTEYQTVVTKEGNVTEPALYNDFFDALQAEVGSRSGGAAAVRPAPGAGPVESKPLPPGKPQ